MSPRRPLVRAGALLAAAGSLVLLPSAAASAHPLGNFTVNRYDGLVVAPGELRVRHVEDLAEIPAAQARPAVERLGLRAWADERCADAARDSRVTVGGGSVPLTVARGTAEVRPGQAGLDTLRVACELTGALPENAPLELEFRAAGEESGPGWREITARGDRMTLIASDVPERSVSRELSAYPEESLSSPADTASASLRVRPGGPALAEDAEGDAPAASVLPRGADRWTRALDSLVARHDLTFGFALLAVCVAVGLGAAHALAPGHGKTLMAAVAAARGGRARLRDVLPLAGSVTVTHTLGVVVLGLLVTAGSTAAPAVVAWLGVASGLMVTGAGLTLARRAWRHRTRPADHAHGHGQPHGRGHDDAHPHGHRHGPDGRTHGHRPHGHGPEDGHAHPVPSPGAPGPERVPVTVGAQRHPDEPYDDGPHRHAHTHPPHRRTASARPRPHDHGHDQDHGHDVEHGHPHDTGHDHRHGHDHAHSHDHHPAHRHGRASEAGTLTHTHGGFTHTHSTAPTLRGTILLGFAGGLVPSPSAVVVLVGAMALGQAWFGFLLVLAYGAGLALTLTAAGFAVVRAGAGVGRLMARRPRWTAHPLVASARGWVPLASALLVVALGTGLVLRGAASALG